MSDLLVKTEATISQPAFARLAGTTRQAVYSAVFRGHIKLDKKRRVVLNDDTTQLWLKKFSLLHDERVRERLVKIEKGKLR